MRIFDTKLGSRCSPDPGPLPQVRPGPLHADPVGGEDRGWEDLLQSLPRQSSRPLRLQTSLRRPLRPQSGNISWLLDVVDWTDHLVSNDNHDPLEISDEISHLVIHRITKIRCEKLIN